MPAAMQGRTSPAPPARADLSSSRLQASKDPMAAFAAGRTVAPVPMGNTSIVTYTFGPGQLGIQLDDAQGGTRVVIGGVVHASQADRMSVPVGGTIMKIGNRTVTGHRKAIVGKWLAAAERPLIMDIMHPGGAAAAHAGTEAANAAEDPFALEYNAPQLAPTDLQHPAASLGPISSHTFKDDNLGFKDLREVEEGVVIAAIAPGSAASQSGVPFGGIIIAVNGDEARMQKSALSRQMSSASKPMTLMIVAAPPSFVAQAKMDTAVAVDTSAGGPKPYTFEQGALGLTFEPMPGEAGGVVVSHVSGAAVALGVPVGGLLVRINTQGVSNLSKNAIGKIIAKAPRPLTLYIRTGSPASKATADLAASVAAAEPTEAVSADTAAPGARRGSTKGSVTTRNTGGKAATRKTTSTKSKSSDVAKTSRGDTESKAKKGGGKTSRPPKADSKQEWSGQAQPEPPPTVKFSFEPGPLGLGLSDAPSGKGVIITEVAPGSAASELGVEPGGTVLMLNGSDVTGHGKVNLGKMIGYLPRPLVMTLSVPPKQPEPDNADSSQAAATAVQVTEDSPKKKSRKTTRKSRKTARKSVKEQEDPNPLSGSTTAEKVPSEKDVPIQVNAEAPYLPKPSAQPLQNAEEKMMSMAVTLATPATTAGTQEEKEQAAPEVEGVGDEEVHNDGKDEGSEDEEESDADDADASPTGNAPAGSEESITNVEDAGPPVEEKAAIPRRAHPPPAAPKEAYPDWASQPPNRSPRHVVGADAKYILKPTNQVFSHPSLTQPAAAAPFVRRASTINLAAKLAAAPAES
jgi:S1-C subfamily serine protease